MPRILLIEDDEQLRIMLRQALEQSGYDVLEAANGNEGLSAFRQARADLVVTDIMMPQKDGVETIRELRRDFPEARIIAITGFRGVYNRLPAAEYLGAKRTLVKPFAVQDFLHTVQDVLNNDRA